MLESAVERDPGDWKAWTDLGRAQMNTGDEEAARASLETAVEVAEGRRDAWRDNTRLVLERMARSLIQHGDETLRFSWLPLAHCAWWRSDRQALRDDQRRRDRRPAEE